MKLASTTFLSTYLSTLFMDTHQPVSVTSRHEFQDCGTFPAEVVICEMANGETKALFCKYLEDIPQKKFDHRNGMAYEAYFYRTILAIAPVSTITYYGHTALPDNGGLMMVLEYLGDDVRIDQSTDPDILNKAALWIAKFHSPDLSGMYSQVRKLDAAHFIYWLRRFEHLSAPVPAQHAYIKDVVQYFATHLEILLSPEQRIIHGEYYPKNILVKEGVIYPVDWECAAVGPAEIDLACLIEGWDNTMAEQAKASYYATRGWQSAEKLHAEKRLLMAQLYLFFRWWPERWRNVSVNAQSHLMSRLQQLKEKIGREATLHLHSFHT